MTEPAAEPFIERLDRVKPRLERLATNNPPQALTDPHPKTGDQWDWGQEWEYEPSSAAAFWREPASA